MKLTDGWHGEYVSLINEKVDLNKDNPFIQGIACALKNQVIRGIEELVDFKVVVLEEETIVRPEIKDTTFTIPASIGWRGKLKLEPKS